MASIRSEIEIKKQEEDLINSITEGLEDFIEGRCKYFKDDEEIENLLNEPLDF